MDIRYHFDAGIPKTDQDRIQTAIAKAFDSGDIAACRCSAVEAMVYETRPPDFQASISCTCDAMRPLYSSTPDDDD